tara:strand:- start:13468 stop:13632 length:165 start_codon:yes stop_codon:yes gene_type:complete
LDEELFLWQIAADLMMQGVIDFRHILTTRHLALLIIGMKTVICLFADFYYGPAT